MFGIGTNELIYFAVVIVVGLLILKIIFRAK
jgi:hypothetical protein